MKVSELEGAALDAAVAQAEGIEGLVEKDGRMCHVREWDPEGFSWRDSLKDWVMWVDYAPSQRWDHGGPIIERERIDLCAVTDAEWCADTWVGNGRNDPDGRLVDEVGPTPLVAAMRCYVASKFGDEVPAITPGKDMR